MTGVGRNVCRICGLPEADHALQGCRDDQGPGVSLSDESDEQTMDEMMRAHDGGEGEVERKIADARERWQPSGSPVGLSETSDLGAVEVLMEDGSWEPGRLISLSVSREGAVALIRWGGVTARFWRHRGRGYRNEWRYA